ncbi:hypothetical protein [uncultured Mediterranean phage uvMED]|nr:hypothetical protein [uncultured Mediterranean phage uvMED]
MKDEIEKLSEKLDKIDDRIDRIDKHLAVYNNQLEFHIKRTNKIEDELKPLKSSFFKAQGALAFLGILGLITGIFVGIINLKG